MRVSPRQEALRAVSKDAFGQAYRLELMLAIADDLEGVWTLTGLADQLGLRASSLQAPLQALIACHLLAQAPTDDSRSKYYYANVSSAWEWARELGHGVDVAAAAATATDPH